MGFILTLISNKGLIIQMTKREVLGRYKGSAFGLVWSFFNPLIMLAVYTFVFGIVFKARWGADGGENFSLLLFTGLIFHALLAEVLVSAPNLITTRVNYVKKVVFPLEILPFVSVFTAAFHFMVSMLILLLALLVVNSSISITWLYLPFVFLPLLFICLGVSWFLSSLGVYIRDISQLTGVLATLLMFLCPIFYPLDAIPEQYRIYILMNPLSYLVEQARAILVFGLQPNILVLSIYSVAALAFSQLSFWWFMKTKKGFADVL